MFTTEDARAAGLTRHALAWAEHVGRCRSIGRGVYGKGPENPSSLDRARADVLRSGREARGALAGVLHGLDSVVLDSRPTRWGGLPPDRVLLVGGIPCADGLATLVDLAATLDDITWEQAMESALRKRLTTVGALGAVRQVGGVARIRRVLALRPPGAPATESLLETLMVQLARDVPEVGELVRQFEVWEHGVLIARLDLCRPDVGFFLELDGQQHEGQPVYDAMRQNAVVAATGWLPGPLHLDRGDPLPGVDQATVGCPGPTRRRAPASAPTQTGRLPVESGSATTSIDMARAAMASAGSAVASRWP